MTNGTMIQFFHWYIADDGQLWDQLKNEAERLASLSFNAVWIPPAHKGTNGGMSVGYDVYDIYDLGEFDQKGSVRTKYGTRQQLIDAIKTAQSKGLQVYVDIVVNHMGGADDKEVVNAYKVDPQNRNETVSDVHEIEAYTKFTFPGRKGQHSTFEWNFQCFTGVDYDARTGENGVFKLVNDYQGWEEMVDDEMGNYDYLMFADIEFRNPYVRQEMKHYGKWLFETLGFDGVRLDAVKHIAPEFYNEWLDYMRSDVKNNLFAVGEYWAPGDLPSLKRYSDAVGGKMSLFDASLHKNFHDASQKGKEYDLSQIFEDTFVKDAPTLAVTVVDNHDTQPLQSLEAPVEEWFKPLAYAMILLREGGYPCVFYPDMFGSHYTDKGKDGQDHEIWLNKCEDLEKLLLARKLFSYGEQHDYFDHPNCVGWTRSGHEENENSGCAVLISNGDDGFKKMGLGKQFTGKVFVDYLQKRGEEITIDEEGCGEFHVNAGSVSVWILKEACEQKEKQTEDIVATSSKAEAEVS